MNGAERLAPRDARGRGIDYLRVSVTDRCNLRCRYCMPPQGVRSLEHGDILRLEELLEVVQVAAERGVRHVRITGGEPLVRKNVVSFVQNVSALPGIDDVAMTTNGTLLPRFARQLAEAGLARVNISLDSLDPARYHDLTRCGNLDDALAGIRAAFEAGLHPIKINTVVARSFDQDLFAFARLTLDRPLHVRFIEYMPLGMAADPLSGWSAHDVITAAEMRASIDQSAARHGIAPLEPLGARAGRAGTSRADAVPDVAAESHPVGAPDAGVPRGAGPAEHWRFPGAKGTVGFISAVSDHFCARCNRLRLTADGKLRPCLFSDRELDVKAALRSHDRAALEAAFDQALALKPEGHRHRVGTARQMSQMGG